MDVSDGSAGEFYYFGLINQLKETVKLEIHTSTLLYAITGLTSALIEFN